MGYFLLRNDALFVGPAAALNACAAVKVARKLGPGHNIVTILCDGGDRYISKVIARRQRQPCTACTDVFCRCTTKNGLMGAVLQ
jgi:hypothetical protein